LPMPGPYLWRAHQLYQQGVPGIYVYQADSRVLNRPLDRRCMRILSSGNAVAAWWENELATRPRCSKGIYITPPNRYDGYHAWERLRVWTEGIEMGAIEMHLDGQLVSQFEGPPYLLGTEDYESDGLISTGEHELRIRAQDGDGWLEQTFTIVGAG